MAVSKITVDSAQFLEAVSKVPKMKRAPRGSKSSIPKDTIISGTRNGELLVETPVASTVIHIGGAWSGEASLNALGLFEIVKALLSPKKGVPNTEKLELWVSGERLFVRGLTEVSLPLLKL